MSTLYSNFTMVAGEDLNAVAMQFHAVQLSDGKLATHVLLAAGILQTHPKSGEGGAVIYAGESEFRAGGTVAKDARLTVAVSGWITTVVSGGYSVGRALAATASGGIARGLFNFLSPTVVGSW